MNSNDRLMSLSYMLLCDTPDKELRLSNLQARVRHEMILRYRDTGLKDFHCTLGPEALDLPFEELLQIFIDIEEGKVKMQRVEFLDSDKPVPVGEPFYGSPPRSKQPKISVDEFVKKL